MFLHDNSASPIGCLLGLIEIKLESHLEPSWHKVKSSRDGVGRVTVIKHEFSHEKDRSSGCLGLSATTSPRGGFAVWSSEGKLGMQEGPDFPP